MGERGIRIEHPHQFADAHSEAIRSNVPSLLDVVINRDTGTPVTGTWPMPPIPEGAVDVGAEAGELGSRFGLIRHPRL